MTTKLIRHHWQLDVYKLSVETAMTIFAVTKTFPADERYSLTDQVRRSSRAVSAAIAEAWRRRNYEAVFVNKLNEGEGEGAETQTWIEYAVKCGYLGRKQGRDLHKSCGRVIAMLSSMGNNPTPSILAKTTPRIR